MHSAQSILRLSAVILSAAGIVNAAYSLEDAYTATNFFNKFSFFSQADPTAGFVHYYDATAANLSGLAGYSTRGSIFLGVDYKTMNPPAPGRGSVRVTSNKAYTHGLFIADIAHMPGSICGVWPAFWTFGANWPNQGEIDIIEGVNDQKTDSITLHTAEGCNMTSAGSLQTSVLRNSDCGARKGQDGCSMATSNTQGYGDGFNAIGGGVYATEWTSTAIKVWFFPRNAIPADIKGNSAAGKSPDPTTWGRPVASFSGGSCNIDSYFKNHNIVFDTTFCGDWAGAPTVWRNSKTCAAKAATCNEYVAKNPSAFMEAYWDINFVNVYQNTGKTTS